MNKALVLGSLRPGCKACRHSFQEPGDLVCRLNPPQVTINFVPAPPPRVGQMLPAALAAFPSVRPDMFCGQWSSGGVAGAGGEFVEASAG